MKSEPKGIFIRFNEDEMRKLNALSRERQVSRQSIIRQLLKREEI